MYFRILNFQIDKMPKNRNGFGIEKNTSNTFQKILMP